MLLALRNSWCRSWSWNSDDIVDHEGQCRHDYNREMHAAILILGDTKLTIGARSAEGGRVGFRTGIDNILIIMKLMCRLSSNGCTFGQNPNPTIATPLYTYICIRAIALNQPCETMADPFRIYRD